MNEVFEAVKALKNEAVELLRAESHARHCREPKRAAELLSKWYEKKQELDAIRKLLNL